MTKARTRLAVIGAGAFGRKHIDTVMQAGSCELMAIADPSADAAAYATARGIPYFADPTALLDTARPDGVIVATPNAHHVPVGLACAERHVPMLIEKPIAETVEAARLLVESAARTGTPLLIGHHRRHNPVLQAAREIVRGGRLGRLTAVTALWLLQKPEAYFDAAWRREEGGGPLLINFIHDVDDLRFIAGEIASVQAFTASAARGFPVEDTAAVTLRFASGALGTATISDAVAAPWSWEISSGENPMYPRQAENCYLFAGTAGSLTLPKLELWRYAGETGWSAPLTCERIDVAAADPYVRQLDHFCRIIGGEATPLVSGADATQTLAVTLAVRRAAETGSTVSIAPLPT
jgi:predicted dehydrogenase